MADYLKLLREVATIDPPLFVFGGVAEAVLLDRQLDVSHGDVDLLTPRTGVDHRIEQLGDFGFAPFDVSYEPRPGLPLVYGATRDDLALELSVLDYDSAGMPYFALATDAAVVAVAMPADLFEWPPTIVRGVRIHTLSPLALVQIRSGAMTTGAFGPTRPQDTARQARLIEAFFPDSDPMSLDLGSPRSETTGRARIATAGLPSDRLCANVVEAPGDADEARHAQPGGVATRRRLASRRARLRRLATLRAGREGRCRARPPAR